MSNVIYISNARLSFPRIVEPQKQVLPGGREKISYNCQIIMPRDHAGFAAFMAEYGKLALEQWKEHANTIMQIVQADRKTRCYGAGEEIVNKTTFVPYDGYPGNVYISCGNRERPQVMDADGKAVEATNTMLYQQLTRRMYGGCKVNVALKPWLQKPNKETGQSHGVRCDLVAIQFAADGIPFGEATTDASGMFGAVVVPVGANAAPVAPPMPGLPFTLPGFMTQ